MTKNVKHIVISWALFSTLYWIAACFKPFHVDEFYSWVYAQRCTFKEILWLKEFGLGHPPLYHLIQKIIQEFFPSYHFTYVRFANYVFGSLFVIILGTWLLRRKNNPIFIYGICCSATTLDTFVFSRMWGLLCLSSLLLLWSGEKYLENRERRHVAFFLGACILGFLSDYSFILLVPYIGIVLFSRRHSFKKLLISFFCLLIIGWMTTWYLHVIYGGLSFHGYVWHLFNDIMRTSRELMTVLFNFWFDETLLVALLLLLVAMFFDLKSKSSSEQYKNQYSKEALYSILAGLCMLVTLNLLIAHSSLRMWVGAPIVLLVLLLLFLKGKEIDVLDLRVDRNRIILAVIGAVLIILCVSPIFWRNLKYQRFLLILSPFILLLVFRICDKRVINTISMVLIVSGLIYVLSNRVSDYYPAPLYNKEMPVIFQNEFSYSTQYIRDWKVTQEEPYIIDQSSFQKYCKICTMGKSDIDFSGHDWVSIVAFYKYDASPILPSDFVLVEKTENLTWLDRMQFKYLTPLHPGRQATFIYKKVVPES